MSDKILITNLKMDRFFFPPITRTDKDGKKAGGHPFELKIGSSLDDTEECRKAGIPQPKQYVPAWVVEQLRRDSPAFLELEKSNHINVSTPA